MTGPFSEEEAAWLATTYVARPDAQLGDAADAHWLIYCGVLVFSMQSGFAMLCAGSVRAKNAQNILLKNLVDVCVGACFFWATGYGLAFGSRADGARANGFAGNDGFVLANGFAGKNGYDSWFFQFAFAATASTIVSGAVAERCHMKAYAGYSALLTGFVYPVVAHWIWSDAGWLSPRRAAPLAGVGAVDFAGSGVVHMVGGAAAGIGARVLGPRIGRFECPGAHGIERATLDALRTNTPIRGHSMPLVVLGTFLLWIGWYGFNPGSTLGIAGPEQADVAARVAVCTTLSAASGGLTSLFVHYRRSRTYDVAQMCNGILAGLVSTTAGCAVFEPWAAFVVGAVGAIAYNEGARLFLYLEVDDAVNAAPVHYFAGVWGLVATAVFARPANVRQIYGDDADAAGLAYTGDARLLGAQLVAVLCITAWVVATMLPFFLLFRRLDILRVSMDEEIDGLDETKHGGTAYAIDGDTNFPAGGDATTITSVSAADLEDPALFADDGGDRARSDTFEEK